MSQTGLNRTTSEKFYTRPNIADLCINEFHRIVNPEKDDIIIEPSAGNGSFSDILFTKYKIVYAYDIEPANKSIKKQDFLTPVSYRSIQQLLPCCALVPSPLS